MGFLNFVAGLALIVLAIELLVLLFVIAALCGGIWFGLRFAEGKTDFAFGKLNGYIQQARGYEHVGLRLLVKPVIAVYAVGEMIAVTMTTLVERARDSR